jgi:SSS family solute:Na+ symporter
MYAAVPALLLNLAVSASLTLLFRALKVSQGTDSTDASAYYG